MLNGIPEKIVVQPKARHAVRHQPPATVGKSGQVARLGLAEQHPHIGQGSNGPGYFGGRCAVQAMSIFRWRPVRMSFPKMGGM